MFTDQTRATPATRTTELADDIADRIAIACHPDELEGLIADAWVKHRDGRLTANDLEALQEAALARMDAFPEAEAACRPTHPAAVVAQACRPAPPSAPRGASRRPRAREKLFGNGRPVPLDREAKNRIMVLMRALKHPTEKGKQIIHNSALPTSSALAVTG
jgi:hypothetical protein